MTDLSPRQTHTPSPLKWLLTERAALAGAVTAAEKQLVVLKGREKHLEENLRALRIQLAGIETVRTEASKALAGLTLVIENSYPTVDPCAAGSTVAWAGKYGRRGSLKRFVLKLVELASPQPVSTDVIVQALAAQFQLPFATPEDRRKVRVTVKCILNRSRVSGVVVPCHHAKHRGVGLWMLAGNPSLAELRAQAATNAHRPGNGDPDQDATARQMAGQRARGADRRT